MNWLGKQLPDLNDRSQNAGTQVALSCACVLFVSSSDTPAYLSACPACCARPRATQCPLPVPSHAVWPGGRRQFRRRSSEWTHNVGRY